MPAITTSPWQAAVDRFSDKTIVGSKLRSADWADMPLALREKALFSAGVEDARTLSAMREKLLQGLEQARPGGIGMNKSRFVSDMRNLLGAAPGDTGDLTDITSVRRLELVWDFQQADAHGFASRKADLDPNVMDAFPAYRLIRVESRRVPRNWYTRWGFAGASVGWSGATRKTMMALVTSPIWTALSRFGRPWPPFDYGSGMGLESADRAEAESAGLLPKGEAPADRLQNLSNGAAAQQQQWNDGLQASIKGLTDTARNWLKQAFGDQIEISGDQVAWTGRSVETPAAPAPIVETPAPGDTRTAPVSDALTNATHGPLRDEITSAVDAIDSVHDDGDLPEIPIRSMQSERAYGTYHFTAEGKSVGIEIKNDLTAWPGMTTAHEVGHFIDHQVLGKRGSFASVSDPLLADFRAVVAKSDAVGQIKAIMPSWAEFLKPYELWARSYAQYIATASGDAKLLAQLERIRTGRQPWRQWTDEDFKPIATEIENVLRKKGWIQ